MFYKEKDYGNRSPFLMFIYYRRKEFNNASIKQIKDGIIQSGIFYR